MKKGGSTGNQSPAKRGIGQVTDAARSGSAKKKQYVPPLFVSIPIVV